MPFCPKCRSEFQDWVTICPDCRVTLVDSQPPTPEHVDSDLYPVIWAHAVNHFINDFTVTIGKWGLIISAAVVFAVIIGGGAVFYLLGDREGFASGQAEAKTLLTGFHGFLQLGSDPTMWAEFYEKPNAADGKTASAMHLPNLNKYTTNDPVRAQAQVPFAIILPTYLTTGQEKRAVPAFRGLLDPPDKSKVEVYIYLATGNTGIIEIIESNYSAIQSYPELGFGTQQTVIDGMQVLKGKDEAVAFKLGDIYFIIQSYETSSEEVIRVAESLIRH